VTARSSGEMASALGKGLLSGAAGTALMTLAQKLEMKATGRAASGSPAKAVEKVLALEPADAAAEKRLGALTHWAYGTTWGIARGALDAAGLPPAAATAAHFALIWGAELAMLPKLDLPPPATEWSASQIVKDVGFHALYALGVGFAYQYLGRHEH
jgi:hypothetical protein